MAPKQASLPQKSKNMPATTEPLIEGKYTIKDLVDFERSSKIFKEFSKYSGFFAGFMLPDLRFVISAGSGRLCSTYHQACPASGKACQKSTETYWENAKRKGDILLLPCENGLLDAAAPVLINKQRIGMIVTGQVFLEKPDLETFKELAKKNNYPEKAYIQAVKNVPVVSEEHLRSGLSLLVDIVTEFAQRSLDQLHMREQAGDLRRVLDERIQVERSLKETSERFRTIIEQVPAAIYVDAVDEFSTTLYISPQIKEICGFTAQEWINDPELWITLVHPEDREKVKKENLRTNQSGEKFSMEYRLTARDEGVIWVRDEATLQRDLNGTPICWQGFIRNITEEKQTDAALQEAEARYRTLVERLPMIVYVDSVEKLGFSQYVSPQIRTILGYDMQEWMSDYDRWGKAILPGDRKRVLAEFKRTFKSGDPFQAEYRMITHDGRVLWIRDEAVLVRDASGKPAFWHGIMLDITESKQAEIALGESEERYRRLFDLSPDAIAVHRDGKVILANAAAIHLVGARELADVVGKSLMDFVHPDYRSLVNERTRKQVREGLSVPFAEEKFIRLDGSVVDVEVLAAPVRFQDSPASLVIFHEITERKLSQERLDRQFRELSVLQLVGLAVSQATSEDELINNVVQAAGAPLFPVNFGVLLVDEKGGVLRHHPSYRGNATPSEREKLFIPLTEGITGRVARTGIPCRISDVGKDDEYLEFNPPTRSELCVPVKVGEKVIGVLNTESPEADAFTEDDQRLLTTIAGQMTLGIEKLRLFETERLRRQEAETLSQVAQMVTASLDVNEILRLMLNQLKKLLVFDTVSVMLMDDSGVPDIVAGLNFPSESITRKAAKELLKSSPILEQMGKDFKPVLIPDVRQHPGWIWVPGAEHVRSFLAVPMLAHQRMVGCLMLDNSLPDFFTINDLRISQVLAQQMAIAIDNARLYQEALQAADRRSILHRVSQDMVTAIQEPEVTYHSIREATRQLMSCDSFVIALHDPVKEENIVVYALEGDHRFPVQKIPAGRGLTGRVVLEGVSVIVDDLLADKTEVIRMGEPQPVRSLVAVPLRLGQNTTGMISAQSYQANAYHEEEQALLEMLASYAAVAIENARLYQDALRAAERRSILHEASQEIIKVGLDLELVYEAIHRAAGRLMPAEAFVLSIIDDKDSDKILAAYLYDEGKRWPSTTSERDVGLSGKVINTGLPILINDLLETPLPEAVGFGEGDDVRSILAVPLRLGDKVFGMISVQTHLPNSYTEDDQALLDMLGAHATAAIENARLYSETHQRLTELEAVNRISTALRVAQTGDQMLPRLLDESLKILNSDSGVIWLFDRSNGVLVQAETRGWFSRVHETPIRPGDGIAGLVYKTGNAIVSREFLTDDRTRDDTRMQIPSGWGGACVPIRTGHDVIGVLFVSVQLPRQLNQGDVGLLTTITEIAGNAIHRSTLYEQSQRQLQRLASLRTIDMAINTVLDLRVTLSILIDHLLSQLNVDAVAVFLLNPTTQVLYHGASEGFRSDLIQVEQSYISDGFTGQVARTRTNVYVPRLAENQSLRRTFLTTVEGFVSYYGVPLLAKGQVKGVLEIFHRDLLTPDLEWKNFLETLAGQAALAVDNATLFEELQRTNVDLSLAYDATIEGWSKALDLRDRETEGHTQRVAELSLQLAKKMGVGDTERVHMRRGALLHDIGKMGVPDSILYKAGPLDDDEWQIMRQHPVFAYEMLYPISYLRPALDIPYGHHERWDGSGYPRKLKGEQIPLAARIFAVVDVWDALTSDRPYRQAWTKKHTFSYIEKAGGTHFDPKILSVFLEMTT